MLSRKLYVAALCCSAAICTWGDSIHPARESRLFRFSSSIQVAYDVQGTGSTPVILLHSLGGAKESWDSITPGLLEICNCRLYRIDLKGHGDTSAPNDHHYSLDDNAALVRALMQDQRIHGAVLIGHSYGGAVALTMALDARQSDPAAISGLVLIGTPAIAQRFPFLVAHHRYQAYGTFIDRVTTPRFRAWVAVHSQNFGNTPGVRQRVDLYSRLWSDRSRTRASRETAREFIDGGGLRKLAARDHDTGVPTLVIAGERDHLVGVAHARQLAATIEAAKLFIVPKAGHSPQEDMPGSVLPILADFLAQVGR